MSAVERWLDRALEGDGAVVGVVGSPGIGKSRLVREVRPWRRPRRGGVHAFCESYASQVPFDAVAQLLRAAFGVEGLRGRPPAIEYARRFPTQTPRTVALR